MDVKSTCKKELQGTRIPLHNTSNGTSSDRRVKTASVSVSILETVTIPPYSELETVAGWT